MAGHDTCACGRKTWHGRMWCAPCTRERRKNGLALEEPREVPATECECGAVKEPSAEACDRCAALDGKSAREADVIWALRLYQEADMDALEVATGMCQRNVYRALAALTAQGRAIQRHDAGVSRRGGAPRTFFSLV